MLNFFKYNWQIRNEWLEWCEQLTTEELLKKRTGGVGSILYTLFHIIDVEYSWIRAIQGKDDLILDFNDYNSLEKVKSLSEQFYPEISEFLERNEDDLKDELITVPWDDVQYTKNDILHHIIAHEIHHIGQLSVWARELDLKPVSVNYVGRNFT